MKNHKDLTANCTMTEESVHKTAYISIYCLSLQGVTESTPPFVTVPPEGHVPVGLRVALAFTTLAFGLVRAWAWV